MSLKVEFKCFMDEWFTPPFCKDFILFIVLICDTGKQFLSFHSLHVHKGIED